MDGLLPSPIQRVTVRLSVGHVGETGGELFGQPRNVNGIKRTTLGPIQMDQGLFELPSQIPQGCILGLLMELFQLEARIKVIRGNKGQLMG